jgi:hypothetical protein
MMYISKRIKLDVVYQILECELSPGQGRPDRVGECAIYRLLIIT